MGLPPWELLETASRRKLFFDSNLAPRVVPNSQGRTHTPASKSLQVGRAQVVHACLFLLQPGQMRGWC